ncbi:hypothetical protein PG987_001125 [Apiospora arundinis]
MLPNLQRVVGITWILGNVLQPAQTVEPLPSPESCRCFPGDKCWPTDQSWNHLNKTVGGRLVATIPLGSPCHGLTYNEARCQGIRDAWNLPDTHIDSSASIMAFFFANQSCDPFLPRAASCVIGTYVQYAVAASSVSDYQATIKFARAYNIRLVIRNTGHDYFGKSTGSGGLALWTHNMKSIEVLDPPASEHAGKALRVGAGVQLIEAYRAAFDSGLVVVGGTSPSVGFAGGYVQGGGHGYLASRYGLAADQVLSWEVVTMNGTHLTVSPFQHQDLYWALSGGGGGAYAAVVSMTVKAYPDQTTAAATLAWNNTGISQDTFYAAIEAYLSSLPSLLDAGATATWLNTNDSFMLDPAFGFGMSKQELDSFYDPVLQQLNHLNVTYDGALQCSGVISDWGRLIPRSILTESVTELTRVMREIGSYGAAISGLSFKSPDSPIVPNSISPAFREASISLVIGTNTDRDTNIANQKLMTDVLIPQLADLITGGGSSYLNEGDPWEPRWQDVFYGEGYGRLLAIKRLYDPEALLYARTAVGSESWVERLDGRLCRADMVY